MARRSLLSDSLYDESEFSDSDDSRFESAERRCYETAQGAQLETLEQQTHSGGLFSPRDLGSEVRGHSARRATSSICGL